MKKYISSLRSSSNSNKNFEVVDDDEEVEEVVPDDEDDLDKPMTQVEDLSEDVETTESGEFIFKKGRILRSRYILSNVIETTNFCLVVLAKDKNSVSASTNVAIKIMNKQLNQIGRQEASLLSILNNKDPNDCAHIVRMIDSFTEGEHFCIVLEYCLSFVNLVREMGSTTFSLSEVRFMALQMLSALAFMHNNNIIHSDFKLENVLLRYDKNLENSNSIEQSKGYLKIADFGNSMNATQAKEYYDNFELQSFMIRAPEVALGLPFGTAIDMWSFGCVLVELRFSFILFSSTSRGSLIKRMHDTLGPPPAEIYKSSKFYSSHFNSSNKFQENSINDSNSPQTSVVISNALSQATLKSMLSKESEDFCDLVMKLLEYDPSKRLTAAQALMHPFLFPISFDPYLSFVEFQIDVEKERESMKQTIEEEKKKSTDAIKKEKQRYEAILEQTRRSLIEEHRKEQEKLKREWNMERDRERQEHDAEKSKLKKQYEQEREKKEEEYKQQEQIRREKHEREKKDIEDSYKRKILEEREKYVSAEKTIDKLHRDIEELKENLLGEREAIVLKPGKKRKAVQDNTDFEALIKQRHEKKEKMDTKSKVARSEMNRVKSVFGIKPNINAVRDYFNSQDSD